MAILFSDKTYRSEKIFGMLKKHMPEQDLRFWPDTGSPEEIDYAIIWISEKGSLQNLPNLKAIFTVSAGVDGIIKDDTLPDVPLVRLVEPGLTDGMVEYALYHVLKYHRDQHIYDNQQKEKLWQQHHQRASWDRTIGIMGLGEMGQAIAHMLTAMKFNVLGWSRTPKVIEDVKSFVGPEGFDNFLSQTEILVNVLPLTPETKDILNKNLFNKLPRGACIINMGRGRHLIENDLIDALDTDHVAAASLDVFYPEPLPTDNSLWDHPKVTLTPHIASITDYKYASKYILEQIQNFESGRPLENIVDLKLGY